MIWIAFVPLAASLYLLFGRGMFWLLHERFANGFRRHRALVHNWPHRFKCFDCRFELKLMFAIGFNCRFNSCLTAKYTARRCKRNDGAAERRFGCSQFK